MIGTPARNLRRFSLKDRVVSAGIRAESRKHEVTS